MSPLLSVPVRTAGSEGMIGTSAASGSVSCDAGRSSAVASSASWSAGAA